jgi:hypothetical protein
VFIRGEKNTPHPAHPWLRTSASTGTFTPHPQPLSPSMGEGCRGDLGLKPELHWHVTYPCPATHLIRVHSCPFVVQKHRLHSYPFVSIRGSKRRSIRAHSWFKTPPPFVSIRGSKHRLHSCTFVSIRGSKHRLHSCPFVSIRGSKHRFIRVHSCPFVVQNTPLIRAHSCSFVVQNIASIRVHSWFKRRLHSWFKTPPHPWPPLPCL